MSFMVFPPEVNSALMYSGAGSGPLMAAASAWNELAADLETTATSYQAVIQELTGGPWLGPSSVQMTSATAPYIAWLQGSSIQAAQTSAQARLAAAAYEGAFDATVPPTEIAANRTLLAALVATNFLGQNTPAIAATEALYMEMWFQDGLTMDTYALVSQQATALPVQAPAPTTSDGGTSADAAAAAQATANSPASEHQALLNAYLRGPGNTVPNGGTNESLNERLDRRAQRPQRPNKFGLNVTEHAGSDKRGDGYGVDPSGSGPLLRDDVGQHAGEDVDQHGQLDECRPGDAGGPTGGAGRRIPPRRRQDENVDERHIQPDAGVCPDDQRSDGGRKSIGWAVDTERLGEQGAGDGCSCGPGVARDQCQPGEPRPRVCPIVHSPKRSWAR